MIKKAFIPLAIFISGCSSVPIDETYSIFRATLAGFTNQSISAEDYDKSPFSFIQVKIGNASPATLQLAYINDDVFEWRGLNEVSIFTKKGQVIETIGLSHNIKQDFLDVNNIKTKSYINFYNPDYLYAEMHNRIIDLGDKFQISYLEEFVKTDVYHIERNVPSISWSGESKIYSYKGRVIYTEQKIHPRLPILKIFYYYK